jgi:hypothetical protein
MKRVYQTGKQWEFHEEGVPESVEWVVKTLGFTMEEFNAMPEGDAEDFSNTQVVDTIKFIPISDRVHAQLCVLEHQGKFGVYTLDTCKFFGGPGKYFSPSKEAFPYDEILLSNRIDGICYVAFRIEGKWGIEKIVDVDYVNPAEVFTNSYGLTKRRMYVPCEYDTVQSAQLQIINWSNISDFTVDI